MALASQRPRRVPLLTLPGAPCPSGKLALAVQGVTSPDTPAFATRTAPLQRGLLSWRRTGAAPLQPQRSAFLCFLQLARRCEVCASLRVRVPRAKAATRLLPRRDGAGDAR